MQKKRTRKKGDTGNSSKNNRIELQPERGRKNELIGVGLAALGLVFFCGIFGLNVGFVGIYFAKFLQYFCGIGSFIPAIFCIYLGYHYIMQGTGITLHKQSIGVGLMFISLLAIFHHFSVPEGAEILPSSLPNGGGLLGGVVLLILRKCFGMAGAIVMLGAGFVGSVLLTTTWSLASGIFKTQQGVEKGVEKSAEVAKETAAVVYEKAKEVEVKVQEQVIEQAVQFKTNISNTYESWQTRRERDKSFFDQAGADEFPEPVSDSGIATGNAYEGSISEGIGRDNAELEIRGKGFGERVAGAGTVGFTTPDMVKAEAAEEARAAMAKNVAGAVLDNEGRPRKDNVWGISSNPGKTLAKIQESAERKLAENEAESANDEYAKEDVLENEEYENIEENELDYLEEIEETEDEENEIDVVDEENENEIDTVVDEEFEEDKMEETADGKGDGYFQLNIDSGADGLRENDSEDDADSFGEDDELSADDDPYEEENQSYGSSAKGRSWLDDIDDDVLDDIAAEEELLTVGTIGSTMPAAVTPPVPKVNPDLHKEWQEAMAEFDESVEDEEQESALEEAEPEKVEIPYIMPSIEELLDIQKKTDTSAVRQEVEEKAEILAQTLKDFNVKANILAASRGPAITQYEVKPAPGVKVNKITNLSEDIALNLAVSAVRIELIPGKPAIGIEVPNTLRDSVPLREVLEQPGFEEAKSKLTVGLGMDIGGSPVFADLAKMPHLLVAGATGSGKSVCINTLISSILFKAHPDEVKFILVDPKMVELSVYNGIPHLMVPVVTDAKKAASVLNWSVQEMERRYEQLSNAGVRNMDGYNKKFADEPEKKMCSIVIIIDELADLMMVAPHDVEDAICRIAQKARAAGIYLVLATQRPSVNVITGTIKANIPSRISFAVTSQIDSRTILDASGAEKLLGRGDMLFSPVGASKPTRIQGAFISDDEVERLLDFIRSQGHEAEVNQEIIEFTEKAVLEENAESDNNNGGNKKSKPKRRNKSDALMGEALELILSSGQASASNIQRRFRIGFSTAQRIIDNMEELGIVGPAQGMKSREILVSGDEAREILEDWDNQD